MFFRNNIYMKTIDMKNLFLFEVLKPLKHEMGNTLKCCFKFHLGLILQFPSCSPCRIDMTEGFNHFIDPLFAIFNLTLHFIGSGLWHNELHLQWGSLCPSDSKTSFLINEDSKMQWVTMHVTQGQKNLNTCTLKYSI